ncbi:MAG: polyprenyl synthetase family protein [Ruminococcaceae bacterium]|nr:polyprenyl synthetase family protein [Oscillospiraceae bacterium]
MPDSDIDEVADAMKYSVYAGGKRIRAYICLAFCRLFGGDVKAALPFAAAIEMIHTFSLIHDDLPCMDDDDLRRGKPTNHKVYGEATALLAGDALALKAFGVVAENPYVSPDIALRAVRALSFASAERGMVGGQIMDMQGEKTALPIEKLKKLQSLKTGALIEVSARLGAMAAGVSDDDRRMLNALEYAKGIGLAFQIKDDILDVTGDEALLGKPIGSDAENSKSTFLRFMSIEEAEKYAKELTEKAKESISGYEGRENLLALADFLLERNS